MRISGCQSASLDQPSSFRGGSCGCCASSVPIGGRRGRSGLGRAQAAARCPAGQRQRPGGRPASTSLPPSLQGPRGVLVPAPASMALAAPRRAPPSRAGTVTSRPWPLASGCPIGQSRVSDSRPRASPLVFRPAAAPTELQVASLRLTEAEGAVAIRSRAACDGPQQLKIPPPGGGVRRRASANSGSVAPLRPTRSVGRSYWKLPPWAARPSRLGGCQTSSGSQSPTVDSDRDRRREVPVPNGRFRGCGDSESHAARSAFAPAGVAGNLAGDN